MPLAHMWMQVPALALADGPTEVHRNTVAKLLLRQHKPAPGLFPTEHLPPKVDAARARYAAILREFGGQPD
jgi:acyl-CoA dehydrogenase